MPFNPDDFAPKKTGFNPDEFLPSGKSGFNPDEFLPKEEGFKPEGFLPVTQNDFKAAIPEIVQQLKASLTTGAEFTPEQMAAVQPQVGPMQAAFGAVGSQLKPVLNAPPVAGAGAVRGATLGYIDPTQTQAVQGLEVDPLTRQRAEVVGEFAGAAAPITGIAKGVAAGAKMSQAIARMTPWLRGVAEAGTVGGIYGAAKKPEAESLAERAENARDDAALFMAFAGAGEVVSKVAEAVKSANWYRKLTVPERAVALSKYPTLDLPDSEMMEVFKSSPEGVQKVLADQNPKMRRILQTGSSAEPVAQPVRPVEEPLFAVEPKAPEAAPVPVAAQARPLAVSPEREAMLSSQIETAKTGLAERPTAPVQGWKSEPVQGGGTSLESPSGYRVFVPEGQDPTKAAAAIREIERAEYGESQIPTEAGPDWTYVDAVKDPFKKGNWLEKIGDSTTKEVNDVALSETLDRAEKLEPEIGSQSWRIAYAVSQNPLASPATKARALALREKWMAPGRETAPIETPLFEAPVKKPWEMTRKESIARGGFSQVKDLTPEQISQVSKNDGVPASDLSKNFGSWVVDLKTMKMRGEDAPVSLENYSDVKKAISEGKTIPPEVLKDYPELETEYAQKTGAQVEGSGQEVGPAQREGSGVPVRGTQEGGVEAPKGEVAPEPVPAQPEPTPPPSEPPPPTPPVEKPAAMSEPKKSNPRGFIKTVKESGMTTEGLKEEALGIKPQDYDTLPNADVLKSADDIIAKKGTVKALEELMANENPSIEDTAVAIRLMKIYENRGDYDKVIPLLDKFDSVFRKSGRTVQLASLWNRLTPSGFAKTIERTLEKMNVKLDDNFKNALIKKMGEIKRMPEGPERTQATFELLNSVYDKVPLRAKVENWIDAYRYTNMLSSPLSHERNLYGNSLQAFLTRPLDMIGEWGYDMVKHPFNPIARDIKLFDIPKYYQSAFKTIPEASAAFLKALGSNSVSAKIVESPAEGVNFVNESMRANLPKALRVIPNLMEASDRFFSILVASGEKARLMRGGIAEAEAESKAKELAEKLLFRQQLGNLKKGEGPLFVRALDELGKIVLSARNRPVIGKPVSWFAPFVTTVINVAKASVERSPLGFAGGKYDKEQISKAALGSAITLAGAMAALAGKVVWMPPRSKKEKMAFYDSGRLPLSVEVGGRYIPSWWLGPYALAFMLPEAFRYQVEEENRKLSPNYVAAIAKGVVASGRMITEQTPMAGVKDLTDIATGEGNLSSKILARPASQMIPFVGMLRFVANIVDPVYRESNGLIDELKKSVPGLTEDLESYKKLNGTPSTRSLSSLYLPYAINERDARADMEFRNIRERARIKSIRRERRKILREGE